MLIKIQYKIKDKDKYKVMCSTLLEILFLILLKDAVGGVKDYIDNALPSTKSQVLESARESSKSVSLFKFKGNCIQFEFNVKIKEKANTALIKIEKGDTASATSEPK